MKRTTLGLIVAGLIMTLGSVSASATTVSGFGGGTISISALLAGSASLSGTTAFDSVNGSLLSDYSFTETGPLSINFVTGVVSGAPVDFCYGGSGGSCDGSLLTGDISFTSFQHSLASATFFGSFASTGGSLAPLFVTGDANLTFNLNLLAGTITLSSGTITSSVPEPASLLLIGTGLLGLANVVRRKFVTSR